MSLYGYSDKRELVDASRSMAGAVALGENRVLCRVLGKLKMLVDARDITETPHLCMDGIFDVGATCALARIVSPGDMVIDVGACFGYQTLLLCSLVGPTGRVFAFEPHPGIFNTYLKTNIEINEFGRIAKAYPNALGEEPSLSGELSIHKRRYDGSTMSERAKMSYGPQQTVAVNISKLDDLVIANHVKPNVFLVSAEGYEPQVWAGMQKSLTFSRKITVLMDFTPKWYADALAFAKQILDEGFTMCRLNGDDIEPVAPEQIVRNFRSSLVLTR